MIISDCVNPSHEFQRSLVSTRTTGARGYACRTVIGKAFGPFGKPIGALDLAAAAVRLTCYYHSLELTNEIQ